MIDLRAALPHLLPQAIAWAEGVAGEVLRTSAPLDANQQSVAHRVGVRHPERIRVALVDELPRPSAPQLRQAADVAGMLGPGMVGLTLGYAIFVCRPHLSVRLLSHECRHVYQYETAGSIGAFLPTYLQQIIEFGYEKAPLEIDASLHELDR